MKRRVLTCTALVLALSASGLTAGASGAHDIIYVPNTGPFVVEGEPEAGIVVERLQHGSGTATVDVATVGGTASEGTDYEGSAETLSLQPVDTADFTFSLTDDSEIEPLETIDIELSNPTGGPSLATPSATVTVIDNDGPARFSFAAPAGDTYENFGTIPLVVVRSGDRVPAVSVNYSTSDGSAQAGSDYISATGTIEFDAGVRVKRLSLAVTNDRLKEGTEDFTVTLSEPVGAELAEPATITATILDDETPASDTAPPVSYFHLPLHGKTYRPGQVRDILAFADDYHGTGVKRVDIALVAKMTNGSCRWFSRRQKGFSRGSCAEKDWMRFRTDETVVYTLPQKLRSSRGTKIRYYQAWSRAIDEIGNVEQAFDNYRNVSRFEVR